jgi:hypothetical protein
MIRLIPIVFFAFGINLFSQANLNRLDDVMGNFFKTGNHEVFVTGSSIDVLNGNDIKYSFKSTGSKHIIFSPGKEYLLIQNYEFSQQKEDYIITGYIFDKNFKQSTTITTTAPFDLPHGVFSINDNGIIAYFNPLNYSLKIFNGSRIDSMILEKDIPFEMERESFICMNNEFVFIASTLTPVSLETPQENVLLFKVDLKSFTYEKKKIWLSALTYFNLVDDELVLSGVSFEDFLPGHMILKMDKTFSVLAENKTYAVEKLIKSGNSFVGSFSNYVYRFENDLALADIGTLKNDERVINISENENGIILVIAKQGNIYLTRFRENFAFDFNLSSTILNAKNFKRMIVDREVYIHTDQKTYIFK